MCSSDLEPQDVGKCGGAAVEVKGGAAKSYLVVKCAGEEAGSADAGDDFLSSCFTCKKKLEGNDIYIYRYVLSMAFLLLRVHYFCNHFILKVFLLV